MNVKKMAVLLLSACVLISSVAEAGTLTPYSGKRPGFNVKKQTVKETVQEEVKQAKAQVKAAEESASKASSSWKKGSGESISYLMNIGLASGLSIAHVSMNSQYQIIDVDKGTVLDTINGNIIANITPGADGLEINGNPVGAKSVRLQAVNDLTTNRVKFNNTSYRGGLVVSKKGDDLLVVNTVMIDEYLIGTVPAEMSPTWPTAALQAQTVAARTFALYNKNQHRSEGYDLCNATHCQVYEGVRNESDTTTEAVNSTSGYVMIYDGKPIYAPFHSSSGGMTENVEDVWGTYLPYLRSVQDDDSQSPFHNWSVSYTAAQVEKLLADKGHNIGSLKSIQPMPNISTKAVKSASGRSNTVKFIGSNGNVSLSGVQLRNALGLKSTMFTISVKHNLANTKAGVASDAINNLSSKGLLITGGSDEQIIIDGHGFGHGLGMAQWGAKAMAENGKTWQNILNHYYTGVLINKMY